MAVFSLKNFSANYRWACCKVAGFVFYLTCVFLEVFQLSTNNVTTLEGRGGVGLEPQTFGFEHPWLYQVSYAGGCHKFVSHWCIFVFTAVGFQPSENTPLQLDIHSMPPLQLKSTRS